MVHLKHQTMTDLVLGFFWPYAVAVIFPRSLLVFNRALQTRLSTFPGIYLRNDKE